MSRWADLSLIVVHAAWHLKKEIYSASTHLTNLLSLLHWSAITIGLLLSSTLFRLFVHLLQKKNRKQDQLHTLQSKSPFEKNALRPLFFPCRTTHTRLFPKKHSFSYSYLFVGIPVGWQGALGSFLSVDLPRKAKNAWFSVDSSDYLERKNGSLSLKGNLEAYLMSQVNPEVTFFSAVAKHITQGEKPENYPLSYLVTAPRFLGYSFNPVSFWYLYDNERKLKAMILEVNNTFDERRMYFLKDTTAADKDIVKFKTAWPKDFHVSPFNSRKGSYSLIAIDPLMRTTCGNEIIDNTITLKSSGDQAKLVARISSTGKNINPATLTSWARIGFVLSWWWVGFVTFPRIVKEAAKLFFRRKLHVWYRPEVLNSSIGRTATNGEM